MNPILNIAIKSIRKGGEIITKKYDDNNYNIQNKKNYYPNFIKNIIYRSERSMIETILKFYPNYVILNNQNSLFNKQKNITWFIQSIYGKRNFINNFPHFCLSISIYIQKQIEFSIIYDPMKNELFTAIKGQGSQLNGNRIRCNSIFNLNHSILSINSFFNELQNKKIFEIIFNKIFISKIKFRITGCSMLDLMYLSNGRLDCVINFDTKKKFFDISTLHIQETGGFIYPIYTITKQKIPGNFYISNIKYMKFIKNIFK